MLERVEGRLLLSTGPISVFPGSNTHSAETATEIRATFHEQIDVRTTSRDSLIVHSAGTGLLTSSAERVVASGPTLRLLPDRPLFAGDKIQATTTSGIGGAISGETFLPHVWQFRTAVSKGTGFFGHTGQYLGESLIRSQELGDLDGDGDLDALAGNIESLVWLNDGTGTFVDSGQRIGGERETIGLALSDLDGDGDLDAFAANGGCHENENCANRVWLNDGSGIFVDSGQRMGNRISRSVALGDLDGDGDLDAFVGNMQGRSTDTTEEVANTVWLNDGQGNFSDSGQRLGQNDSNSVAIGDLDGDGDLDAYVANLIQRPEADGANRVWLNDGSGNFSDTGQRMGELNSIAVRLGDLDGDADLDAYVGNDTLSNPFTEVGAVWINNGAGDYQKGMVLTGDPRDFGSITNSLDLGDVDADGDLDVFTVTNARNRLFLNDGAANLTEANRQFGQFRGLSASLGDLDSDGDLDAFTGNAGIWMNAEVPTDVSVAIANGQSIATPGQSVEYTVTVTNHGPNDANVVVTTSMPNQLANTRWTCVPSSGSNCGTDGEGNVVDSVSLLAGHSAVYSVTGSFPQVLEVPTIVATASIDTGPGMSDIVPFNNQSTDEDVAIGLSLSPAPNSTGAGLHADISRVYASPVDADTVNADSFVVHTSTGRLLTPGLDFEVQGHTVVASPVTAFMPGETVRVTATSRVLPLGGSKPDQALVWEFTTATNPASGLFQFGNEFMYRLFGGSSSELGDLDGDGDLDAFVTDFAQHDGENGKETVWLNDGNGAFSDSGQRLGDVPSKAAALGDLDGDGDLDAFVVNDGVWLNDGQAVFRDSGQRLGVPDGNDAALGDLDGDGDIDVLVASSASDTVWINDGRGQFHRSTQNFPNLTTYSVALADLDGDGDLDALLEGPNNEVWLNDGRAQFRNSGQLLGPRTGRVAAADLDDDGAVDAIFGKEIWLNSGSARFRDTGQRLDAYPDSLALGDVEGDGDIDILLGRISIGSSVWHNDGRARFEEGQFLRQVRANSVSFGDLDGDGDLDALFTELGSRVWLNNASPGDVTGNGRFDQADVVRVLEAGKFGTGEPATWREGDWNRDGVFDRLDIILALQFGFDGV